MSPDGVEIGKVTKEFSGALRELVTDADNFAVLFPIDLDVRMKATLLGAVFMIVSNLDQCCKCSKIFAGLVWR